MKLIENYPTHIQNDEKFTLIQEVFEKEATITHEELQDLFNQFSVFTATWGLYKWEQFAGIPSSPDLSLRTRRQNVLNALRGNNTTTVKVIKNLAESYSGGECEVKEYNNEHKFVIKFIGVRGIPAALNDLTTVIEQVKPAHLAYEYVFTYMNWDECTLYRKTWDQWEALNLTWAEFEAYWQGYKAEFLEWSRFERYNRNWNEWSASWITWDEIEIYV